MFSIIHSDKCILVQCVLCTHLRHIMCNKMYIKYITVEKLPQKHWKWNGSGVCTKCIFKMNLKGIYNFPKALYKALQISTLSCLSKLSSKQTSSSGVSFQPEFSVGSPKLASFKIIKYCKGYTIIYVLLLFEICELS